jgi:hypothetical protein
MIFGSAAAVLVFGTTFSATVGLMLGLAMAALLKNDYRAVLVDSVLGCAGFRATGYITFAIPWHGCFVDDGWTICGYFPYVKSTTLGMMVLLPFAHETYRWIRRRRLARQAV